MFVGALCNGIDRNKLELTYKNRSNVEMAMDIGKSIASFANATPGGLLVFFASYSALVHYKTIWEVGVFQQLSKNARIVIVNFHVNIFPYINSSIIEI